MTGRANRVLAVLTWITWSATVTFIVSVIVLVRSVTVVHPVCRDPIERQPGALYALGVAHREERRSP